ncbi:MAG: sugar isomerase domain-containing protein [Thiobacillaceae bacterium]
MAELAGQYLTGVMDLLRRIHEEESGAIAQAAGIMADAVADGKRLFAFGCTHSSLPIQDLVYRAGGLMLINPIFGPGIASLDIRPATMSSMLERLSGYARVLLDSHPVQAGDVLIIVSVSGRNAVPIEMAQSAKERGLRVIGVTSRAYAGSTTSRHPSGKKMHDLADVVLDNKVEAGDAFLRAPGVPQAFCPASGVTSTALLQALVAATIEQLLARGITPPVFLAGNVDGGMEYNARLIQEHRDRIFYM